MNARKLSAMGLTILILAGQAAPAMAGRYGGAGRHWDRVQARSTDVYVICFRGHQQARICVFGDGDTDLDLIVYDENGNRIESDTRLGDQCVVRFTPAWTGEFRIEVRNLGRVYNDYRLETN